MRDNALGLTAHSQLLELQRHLLEVIVQLFEIDHRLYEISELVPLSPLYINMEEGSIPYGGFGHLYATLQRVKARHLKPAIEALCEGSQTSNADAIAAGAQ